MIMIMIMIIIIIIIIIAGFHIIIFGFHIIIKWNLFKILQICLSYSKQVWPKHAKYGGGDHFLDPEVLIGF